MIIVQNGDTLISTANEDEVMFVEPDEQGNLKPLGRTTIGFELLTGSIQTRPGKAIDSTSTTRSTANMKWFHTVGSQDQEGGYSNLRVKGVATVAVCW